MMNPEYSVFTEYDYEIVVSPLVGEDLAAIGTKRWAGEIGLFKYEWQYQYLTVHDLIALGAEIAEAIVFLDNKK